MKKMNQEELDELIEYHNLYLETLANIDKRGRRLVLDEIDFTDNDLSKLNFAETYITGSLFESQKFQNTNFGDAKLYDCNFKNTIFKNCNLGKTAFNYSRITDSQFCNCSLVELETLETYFEGLLYDSCILEGAFSNCIIQKAQFIECTFKSTEFWQCIVDNLKIYSKNKAYDIKRMIDEINIGTIEKPNYIKGKEARKSFESKLFI